MDPTTQSWLDLQCAYISDSIAGLVLLGSPGTGPYELKAKWPADQPVSASLNNYAQGLMAGGVAEYSVVKEGAEASMAAYPIRVGGQHFGFICLYVGGQQDGRLQEIGRQLAWGCDWFTWLARERKSQREQDNRLLALVELIAKSMKYEGLEQTAQSLADNLQQRLGCRRVSLGVIRGSRIQPVAISGGRHVEEAQPLLKSIRRAMDEACEQKSTIVVAASNAPGGGEIKAHQQLLEDNKLGSVCTVPMIHNGEVIGAINFEGLADNTIDSVSLRFYEQLAILMGPIIRLKNVRPRTRLSKKIKLSSPVIKWSLGLLSLLFLAVLVIPVDYQVSATATVSSEQKQILAAPQDGYIAEAIFRSGDSVTEGQIVARMDSRDLLLEQKKWLGKKSQAMKSYNNALGSQDRSEINISRALISQADAQLSLIENQLSRTDLTAPFDGLIISGDLSQSLGVPVKRGQVLFELAASGDYKILLAVDERDITFIQLGQSGELRLSSLPGETIMFSVTRITPVAITSAGENYFQVEAAIGEHNESLSPGMSGIAKVEAGSRPLVWIWFHRASEQIRLWLWQL
jgi:HlyD family secretion protein/GAF domain-containing protein